MHGNVAPSARVAAVREHVACEVAGETVILSLPQGMYYGLDEVGSAVWKLLQEPTTPEAIRDALVGEYDVDAERCERDVLTLLRDLSDHGLVRFADAARA